VWKVADETSVLIACNNDHSLHSRRVVDSDRSDLISCFVSNARKRLRPSEK